MSGMKSGILRLGCVVLCAVCIAVAGCKAKGDDAKAAGSPPFMSTVAAPPPVADDAPSPESVGGFDGKKAFGHVVKQVGFGPHPSGSPAIGQVQDYLLAELKSYGCTVETDAFTADTPIGRLPMKNILVKIPGDKVNVILLGTHYDTKLMDNFVGANDGGSSTAVMLEMARLLCQQHGRYAVWIAFFDGEEAMQEWSDSDSRYGSREMAARFATDGEISRIKAFLLADMVGSRSLHFVRESDSNKGLTDLMWSTAAKLGYSGVFLNTSSATSDDHDSFLRRNVPSMDVIDFDREKDVPFWHTPEDTLDKISAKSMAITGHVFLETVKELQAR